MKDEEEVGFGIGTILIGFGLDTFKALHALSLYNLNFNISYFILIFLFILNSLMKLFWVPILKSDNFGLVILSSIFESTIVDIIE